MIVYHAPKDAFASDVLSGDISGIVHRSVQKATGGKVAESEVTSWQNSLMYMNNVLGGSEIPSDGWVSIEYHVPRSSKRIDFMFSGRDAEGKDSVVLVELKQWSEAQHTGMDGIVRTRFKYGWGHVSHPSYQAWSYATLLSSFNAAVHEGEVALHPCAYCHNYAPDADLQHPDYAVYTDKAPLFLKPDALKLRAFIAQHVRYGDDGQTIYKIEKGRIRPSKSLADALESMLAGNEEFVMLDEQKVVYERALALSAEASEGSKKVLLVEGGPGTGKSVVAVNLLVELTRREQVAQYVTKNSPPGASRRRRAAPTRSAWWAHTESRPSPTCLRVREGFRVRVPTVSTR